jgi:hypothetical protein
MLWNLLVFLFIWHILDLNLWNTWKYKVIFLVLSVLSLIILSKKFLKKDLDEIQKDIDFDNIKENNKNPKKDISK